MPTPEEIADDLSVLQELSKEAWRASVTSAEEAAFDEEIRTVINALSQDDQIDLDDFLSGDTTTASTPEVVGVAVEAELAAAMKLDQVNILQNKKSALDDVRFENCPAAIFIMILLGNSIVQGTYSSPASGDARLSIVHARKDRRS